MRESTAIKGLENRFMTKQRRATYIALEELNFVWDEDEINVFIKLWKEGADFRLIAEHFDRDQDEIALLLMDLARKGRVKPRDMGLIVRTPETMVIEDEEEVDC